MMLLDHFLKKSNLISAAVTCKIKRTKKLEMNDTVNEYNYCFRNNQLRYLVALTGGGRAKFQIDKT